MSIKMKPITYTVYALADPNTKQITYIGVTCRDIYLRLYGHIGEAFAALSWIHTKFNRKHGWLLSLYSKKQLPIVLRLVSGLEVKSDAYEIERNTIVFIKSQRGNTLINGHDKEMVKRPKIKNKGIIKLFKKHGIKVNLNPKGYYTL